MPDGAKNTIFLFLVLLLTAITCLSCNRPLHQQERPDQGKEALAADEIVDLEILENDIIGIKISKADSTGDTPQSDTVVIDTSLDLTVILDTTLLDTTNIGDAFGLEGLGLSGTGEGGGGSGESIGLGSIGSIGSGSGSAYGAGAGAASSRYEPLERNFRIIASSRDAEETMNSTMELLELFSGEMSKVTVLTNDTSGIIRFFEGNIRGYTDLIRSEGEYRDKIKAVNYDEEGRISTLTVLRKN